MKLTFSERVAAFKKSLLGGGSEEGEGKKKGKGENAGDDDLNLDNSEGGGEPGDVDVDGDDDDMKKSYADATEIMTALVGELKGINKSLDTLLKRNEGIEKSQADFGESIVGVAEMLAKIGNQPNTVKAAMGKSLPANGGAGAGSAGGDVLTKEEFEQAQKALAKSFNAKEITLFESSRLESEMQKAMTIVGYQMTPADRATIAKALKIA
ncbi:hypothetical protein AGMMS50268_17200 [Spirochaetia bacterium]|nr:hypothetical protein AGMMS50268_17200 [Spirochaetia bacterium]